MNLCRSIVLLSIIVVGISANGEKTLQGRILSPGTGTNLTFKTDSGKLFNLLRTRESEALFLDKTLHAKTLVLKGKTTDKGFQVTGNIHSIKNGKLHELYYYCDICAITSSFPELCQCCREPVRLVEKTVE